MTCPSETCKWLANTVGNHIALRHYPPINVEQSLKCFIRVFLSKNSLKPVGRQPTTVEATASGPTK